MPNHSRFTKQLKRLIDGRSHPALTKAGGMVKSSSISGKFCYFWQDLSEGESMRLIIFACCVLLAAAPLFAHHSFGAEYDVNKHIKLLGIVTIFIWKYPYFYFLLHVQ